ncbi:MAG: hypothetical protein RLY19_379, partial [Actinomycetota bacterium]
MASTIAAATEWLVKLTNSVGPIEHNTAVIRVSRRTGWRIPCVRTESSGTRDEIAA